MWPVPVKLNISDIRPLQDSTGVKLLCYFITKLRNWELDMKMSAEPQINTGLSSYWVKFLFLVNYSFTEQDNSISSMPFTQQWEQIKSAVGTYSIGLSCFLPHCLSASTGDAHTQTHKYAAIRFDPHHRSALKGDAFRDDVSFTQPGASVIPTNSFHVEIRSPSNPGGVWFPSAAFHSRTTRVCSWDRTWTLSVGQTGVAQPTSAGQLRTVVEIANHFWQKRGGGGGPVAKEGIASWLCDLRWMYYSPTLDAWPTYTTWLLTATTVGRRSVFLSLARACNLWSDDPALLFIKAENKYMHAAPISLHSQGVVQLLQGLSWDFRTHLYTWAPPHPRDTHTHIYLVCRKITASSNFPSSFVIHIFVPTDNHCGAFQISPTLRKIGNKKTRMSRHTYNTVDTWGDNQMFRCIKK